MLEGLPPCATCGATRGQQIAPNFVSCSGEVTSIVEEERVVAEVPNPADPHFGRRVPQWATITVTRSSPCSSKHHVPMTAGVSIPRCSCGTFAIGLCAHCEAPICGDDSTRIDGLRLCESCRLQHRALEADRRHQEAAQSRPPLAPPRPISERSAPCGHRGMDVAPDGHCWKRSPAKR